MIIIILIITISWKKKKKEFTICNEEVLYELNLMKWFYYVMAFNANIIRIS